MQEQIYLAQNGASREGLPVGRVKAIRIIVPPLSEQLKMVTAIDKASHHLLKALLATNREIDLVREYRTQLIADVVTGKLDVCGVELPELSGAEEIESLSDVADEELEDSEELVAADGGADAD
jgi:type I restriction enzyme S subunit